MKHVNASILVFFISGFFLAPKIYAQHPPSIKWERCFGGSYDDIPYSIIQTRDGGYTIAGITSSGDYDAYNNHTDTVGIYDAFIVHLDSNGFIFWANCLGGTGSDYVQSIIQTSDGGYAIAGATTSNNGDVSGNHGDTDAWVAKLDENGYVKWQHCLGGTGTEWAYSIIETKEEDKSLVVVGYTKSNDGDVSGKHPGKAGDSSEDAWILKLNSLTGNIEWQKCIGGSASDRAYSVIETADNNLLIAGTTKSNDGDVSGNHGRADAWIVKLDPRGQILSQKCYGGSGSESAQSIIQTSDKGYAFAGWTDSQDGDVHGLHTLGNNFGSDFWIVKLDTVGNLQWQNCFGGIGGDHAYSILQTQDGGYAACGNTNSDDGDVYGFHQKYNYFGDRENDVWLIKLSSLGNLEWQKCLGGSYNEQSQSFIKTSDGGYGIAASSNSNDGDVSGLHLIVSQYSVQHYYDFWIVKLNPVSNVGMKIDDNNFSTFYPNPSTAEVHVEAYSSPVKEISIYDVMGIRRFPKYTIKNNMITIDVHTLPTGIYTARIGMEDNPDSFLGQFIVQH